MPYVLIFENIYNKFAFYMIKYRVIYYSFLLYKNFELVYSVQEKSNEILIPNWCNICNCNIFLRNITKVHSYKIHINDNFICT